MLRICASLRFSCIFIMFSHFDSLLVVYQVNGLLKHMMNILRCLRVKRTKALFLFLVF